MHYIKTADGNMHINMDDGVRTINRKSFNYNKIKNLLEVSDTTTAELVPLLRVPDLPNGVYEAYLSVSVGKMYYIHTNEDDMKGPVSNTKWLDGKGYDRYGGAPGSGTKDEFLGVYASVADLVEDWPEYVL